MERSLYIIIKGLKQTTPSRYTDHTGRVDCCSITHSTANTHFTKKISRPSMNEELKTNLPMLTKMCTAPYNLTVFATAFLHDSSDVTSAWMTSEMPPSSSIMRFVCLAQSTLKSTSATLHPCLASKIAAARPLPISPFGSSARLFEAKVVKSRVMRYHPCEIRRQSQWQHLL